MRIVGGRLRGRSLAAPASRAIRPTADRARETIFNILDHAYVGAVEGARVIDLFAGTGALGFEALSRGAASVVFVDEAGEARALLRANMDALGLGGLARIMRHDATRLGPAPGAPFGLAFLDPPYGRDLVPPTLAALDRGGWLEPGALCVVEEAAEAALILPLPFVELDCRRSGDTALRFCRYAPAA